jgi:hypothetical protein
MSGQLDVWKLLDDAHNLVVNLHDKIETPFWWLLIDHFVAHLYASIFFSRSLFCGDISSLLVLCSKHTLRRLSIFSNAASCSLSSLSWSGKWHAWKDLFSFICDSLDHFFF